MALNTNLDAAAQHVLAAAGELLTLNKFGGVPLTGDAATALRTSMHLAPDTCRKLDERMFAASVAARVGALCHRDLGPDQGVPDPIVLGELTPAQVLGTQRVPPWVRVAPLEMEVWGAGAHKVPRKPEVHVDTVGHMQVLEPLPPGWSPLAARAVCVCTPLKRLRWVQQGALGHPAGWYPRGGDPLQGTWGGVLKTHVVYHVDFTGAGGPFLEYEPDDDGPCLALDTDEEVRAKPVGKRGRRTVGGGGGGGGSVGASDPKPRSKRRVVPE